jgi:O-antigen/teichoic acid export membrane protein
LISRSKGGTPAAGDLPKLSWVSSTDRRILLVSAATVSSRLLGKLAQLGFLVIAARLLTIQEFASYSYLLVLAVTFSLLADTGVSLAANREISAGRNSPAEAFWSGVPVIGLGAALAGSAVLSFGLVDSAPGSAGVPLVLAALFVSVNTVFNYTAATLRGVGRSVFEALLQGLGALAFVGAAVTAVALGAGLAALLAILLAKEAVSTAVAFGGLRHDIGRPRRWTPGLWRRLLRIGIQLGVASTALALVTRVPTFVLGNSGTATELAWFSGAQRLADAVLLLATATGFALLPSLTLLFETDRARARALLRRLLVAATLGGAVLALVSVLLARQIMTVAYGSDFAGAATATRVILAALPAYAIVGIGWYALIAVGRERHLLALAAVSAGASLALSLWLVPGGGEVAAAAVYAGALTGMAVAIVGAIVVAAR